MKVEKKYYKDLDLIRVISCIGVLLYHFGYLQGGFLSVCCFFVLSGYLAYLSLSRKENISLKEYYKNRFFHIYLPLLVVLFLTICFVSFLPNVHWLNLKPETTSILFGYNNYWQLSVNSDYFARHLNSPFMHFWYIAILVQFEIILPFLYLFVRKTKEKIGKVFPMILLILLTLGSVIYFTYTSFQENIMISYYDTFARVYSLLLGVLLGYIHVEYHPLVFQKKGLSRFLFYFYVLLFIILQFFISSSSPYFALCMILTSFLAIRMIDYGTLEAESHKNIFNQSIKALSNVSYEVYLFQYPVIFLFQYLLFSDIWKVPIMILLIFVLSFFLHFSLNFKDYKNKYFRMVCIILLSIFVSYGIIQYAYAKDYTDEMNELRDQLDQNQKLLEEKQKDYMNRLKEEQDAWNQVLCDLENGEAELKNYVSNMAIVGVGDSVMLGATPTLYQQFPNGYFDAKISRTDWEANRILQGIKSQGMLSDVVVIHLGTNGQCGITCQREIIETCEGRLLFWVTVSNDYDVHVNSTFYDLANTYSNVSIIDWYGASNGHPEYFIADGIHLSETGMKAYSDTLYQAIYSHYYQEYQKKKETILKEYEEQKKNSYSFFGGELLLSLYQDLQKDFSSSGFQFYQDYSYSDIKKELESSIQNNTLNKKIILSIDSEEGLSKEKYQELLSILKEYEVTFLFTYHSPYKFSEKNVHTINFYSTLKKHDEYWMADRIHLTSTGNKALLEEIKKELAN